MDCDSLMDCQGAQSQNEGQEDQETSKQLGRASPRALLFLPTPPSLPSGYWLPGNPSSYPNPSNYPYAEAC
jgi:hypothetical protein